MVHTHILNPKTQPDFLSEARRDPITGDTLQAGDEVVFCAHCKSAFLASSWEYLGGKHCGQSDTLAHWPKASKKLILRQRMGERLYPSAELAQKIEMLPLYKNLLRFLMGGVMLALLGITLFVQEFSLVFLIALFPVVQALLLSFVGIGAKRATFYEEVLQIKTSLLTFEKTKTYRWTEIEEITFEYHSLKYPDPFSEEAFSQNQRQKSPKLLIKRKGKRRPITCHVGWITQAHREQIYAALARIPEHVRVNVSLVGKGDPGLAALREARGNNGDIRFLEA